MRPVTIAFLSFMVLTSPAAAGPFERGQRELPRVRQAFDLHLAALETEFLRAGATWPPRGLYLRAFKQEGALELWAARPDSQQRVLVRTLPICRASGELGPKSRAGDFQVPEGFYVIDRFNPRSRFHLSLGIDYPNAVDRTRAAGEPPGGDIFIHGGCVTVGCLPLGDDAISALYVVLVRARDQGQKQIPVHLFPCRFGTAPCRQATAGAGSVLAAFWAVLALAHAEFEATHLPPRFVAKSTGYERVLP